MKEYKITGETNTNNEMIKHTLQLSNGTTAIQQGPGAQQGNIIMMVPGMSMKRPLSMKCPF